MTKWLNSSFGCIVCPLLLFASHCLRPIHILFLRSIFKKLYAYKFICMICTMPVCLSLNQKSVRAQTNIDLSLNRAFVEKKDCFEAIPGKQWKFYIKTDLKTCL